MKHLFFFLFFIISLRAAELIFPDQQNDLNKIENILYDPRLIPEGSVAEIISITREHNCSLLMFDLKSNRVILLVNKAEILKRPQMTGSLLKPLLLISARENNPLLADYQVHCPPAPPDIPAADACWYRPGHQDCRAARALAASCNFYFTSLLSQLDFEKMEQLWLTFQIRKQEQFDPEMSLERQKRFILGLHPGSACPPQDIFFSYIMFFTGKLYRLKNKHKKLRLYSLPTSNIINLSGYQESVMLIKEGMAQTITRGTLSNQTLTRTPSPSTWYIKTGTAPYSRQPDLYHKTTGWVIIIDGISDLHQALILKVEQGTGAGQAFPAARQIIEIVRGGEM